MTVLALLGVVAVLFAAGVVATRSDPLLADAPQDLPDLGLPDGPLRPADVAAVRFSMAPRGYRMSEVDAVLDRLAAELADRDRRLRALEADGGRGRQDHVEPGAACDRPACDRPACDRPASGRPASARSAGDRTV